MKPALEGYASAVLGVPGSDVAALAAELAAIDRLFASNPALRAALTDTAVPAHSRRAVLDALLNGKVSDQARRAAAFAASAVSAPDVPGAIDWLAHRARQAALGDADFESPLSHLAARQRIGGFSAFVLEGESTGQLEEIEDELFRFARTVEATPALRRALTDRDLPVGARQGVVRELLAGKVSGATQRLAEYVIVGGRARDTVGTLDWLVEETARARGWRVARVRSAAAIDGGASDDLTRSLTSLTGSSVEIRVTLDPMLLAGLVVQIGDLQVDASARGRLDVLREHMSSAGWERSGFGQAAEGIRRDSEGVQ